MIFGSLLDPFRCLNDVVSSVKPKKCARLLKNDKRIIIGKTYIQISD